MPSLLDRSLAKLQVQSEDQLIANEQRQDCLPKCLTTRLGTKIFELSDRAIYIITFQRRDIYFAAVGGKALEMKIQHSP
jgi:hypothetical protein